MVVNCFENTKNIKIISILTNKLSRNVYEKIFNKNETVFFYFYYWYLWITSQGDRYITLEIHYSKVCENWLSSDRAPSEVKGSVEVKFITHTINNYVLAKET